MWAVPTGRRDGNVSLASDIEANLPSPFSDFATLLQLFTNKGLDVNDLVVLSGRNSKPLRSQQACHHICNLIIMFFKNKLVIHISVTVSNKSTFDIEIDDRAMA